MAEVIICLLQRYPICGFAFLGADEVGIDLGCADALVGEHLRHCVDVRTQGYLQCGKGVAEAVERDMFAEWRRNVSNASGMSCIRCRRLCHIVSKPI